MDVNVNGVFNTVLPLIERFKSRRNGQIAVVSSISGIADYPRSLSYSMSKTALNNFCRDLRELLSHYNVAVTAICPGFVQTGFTKYSIMRRGSVPLLMDVATATKIIVDGLEKNAPMITFPTPLYLLAFAMRALPATMLDLIVPLIASSKKQSWDHIG